MRGEEKAADGSTADDPSIDDSFSQCDMDGTLVDEGKYVLVESKRQKKKRIRSPDTPGTTLEETLNKELTPRSYSSKIILMEGGQKIDANKVSPVKIAKLLGESLSKGAVKSVKPTRDGGLWITVSAEDYWLELESLSKLGNWEVSIAPQNGPTTMGVIERVHRAITNEDLKEIESVIPIVKAERMEKRVNGEKVPTTCVAITFNASVLPLRVELAYVVYTVRPFVTEPMQCFKCRRFGHKAGACESRQRCARCGKDHKTVDCSAKRESFKCVNCGGAHSAAFVGCPKRKEAHKIIVVSQAQNIARAEVREKIRNGVSFAAVVSNKTSAPESQPSKPKFQEVGETVAGKSEPKQLKKKNSNREAERLKSILKILIKAILSIESAQAVQTLQGAAKAALEVLEESTSDEDGSMTHDSETGSIHSPTEQEENSEKMKKRKKKEKTTKHITYPSYLDASRGRKNGE